MSTQPSQKNRFHITQLSLAGDGAWPDLFVDKLIPQLNVFYAPARAGKSSVARLVGHLLYGKSESTWRRQFAQTVSMAEGSVQVHSTSGKFVLRRHRDRSHDEKTHSEKTRSRLTISSEHGDAVDSRAIQSLLSGLSPKMAAQIFFVDFSESPRIDELLSESFAREFTSLSSDGAIRDQGSQVACCASTDNHLLDRVDRRRIDELAGRRDAIAAEIEQQMSVRRRESEVLQSELSQVEATLADRRQLAQDAQARLRGCETEIAELETQLRYYSLERYTHDAGQLSDVEEQRQKIVELDQEIARCRQSISEVQHRESLLRSELAQYGADGTADSVTCLADGRATLGVLERLLDDLDAEVSQLARANEPGRCVGHGSHAKLSPVAALLRQQVYTLCGQLTEQERIVQRQQLVAESRQLARVHGELGDRLDLLLSRRESIVQGSQLDGQHARLLPQPPAAEHCRCGHHGEFVQQEDSIAFGRASRGAQEPEIRSQLSKLQERYRQYVDEFNGLQHDIEQLEQKWERLQRERGSLLGGSSVEAQQAELERLEDAIRQALQANKVQVRSAPVGYWRASDILAQLTDGQLVQVRLERHHRQTVIVDRQGQLRTLESLSAAEHDQLYLALTLSLSSSFARRGSNLPLILDEPFLQQNAAQVGAMVGVLDEFARAGHQLLVFTEDREAQRRFATHNAKIFDLERIRERKSSSVIKASTVVEPSVSVSPEPTAVIHTTNTRIVRETYGSEDSPVLRLATVDQATEQDDVFYLTENSNFHDFPVLGVDTGSIFSRVKIHSVSDLLAVDADDFARQLNREGITTETILLWQIHMCLMCHVPNLTLDDAQLFAAVGIESPADLFEADIDALLRSIESFLRSDRRGSRFERTRDRYSRSRLSGWRDGARRYRDRWQRSSRRHSDWRSRRSAGRLAQRSQSPTPTERPRRSERKTSQRSSRRSVAHASKSQSSNRQRRFYLSRDQDVEAAPSIGPKTAARLARVGIRTVADLLRADVLSTATKIDKSHITADTISAWQHQARLVCQIPELRGYGAQLLVACGLTQPDQIAATEAEDLVQQVLAFCETKEGQRILRSGDAPQREKIAEWVELATHSRPLEAA